MKFISILLLACTFFVLNFHRILQITTPPSASSQDARAQAEIENSPDNEQNCRSLYRVMLLRCYLCYCF